MASVLEHDTIRAIYYPADQNRREIAISELQNLNEKFYRIGIEETELRKRQNRFIMFNLENIQNWQEVLYDKKALNPELAKQSALKEGYSIFHSFGMLKSDSYQVPFEVEVFPAESGTSLWTNLDERIKLSDRLKIADAFGIDLYEKTEKRGVENMLISVYNACIDSQNRGKNLEIQRYLFSEEEFASKLAENSNDTEHRLGSRLLETKVLSSKNEVSPLVQMVLREADAPVVNYLEESSPISYVPINTPMRNLKACMKEAIIWRKNQE